MLLEGAIDAAILALALVAVLDQAAQRRDMTSQAFVVDANGVATLAAGVSRVIIGELEPGTTADDVPEGTVYTTRPVHLGSELTLMRLEGEAGSYGVFGGDGKRLATFANGAVGYGSIPLSAADVTGGGVYIKGDPATGQLIRDGFSVQSQAR
jgi:hypothetical protein